MLKTDAKCRTAGRTKIPLAAPLYSGLEMRISYIRTKCQQDEGWQIRSAAVSGDHDRFALLLLRRLPAVTIFPTRLSGAQILTNPGLEYDQ